MADNKRKFFIILVGLLTNTALSNAFDYFLYPFVVWRLGIVKGGLVMTCIASLICYLLIRLYDYTKQDWLGIETIKEIQEYTGHSKIFRAMRWFMKKGDLLIMIFLSIKFDPLITTLYMRHGINNFNGMKKRDWMIFFGSIIIGNAYWTLFAFGGVSILEAVFNFLRL